MENPKNSKMQVQMPLETRDIVNLLQTEIHRVKTYIADPQLQPKPTESWANFRDIKVDNIPVPFALCLICRAVYNVSPRSINSILARHSCASKSSEPFPQDETCLDEYLARRMNKVSGPANALYIQEEVRSCFQFCRWADVSLVSSSDQYIVKVHSLVLAAAAPMLHRALQSVPVEQEEQVIIIPDTSRGELVPFISHLYGQTLENTNFNSFLFQLVTFQKEDIEDKTSAVKGCREHKDSSLSKKNEKTIFESCPAAKHDELIIDEYNEETFISDDASDEEYEPEFKTKDIKRLLVEEPHRVEMKEAGGSGRQTKVWKFYNQICIDQIKVPFVHCKFCETVFMQKKNDSTTVIKKHSKTHSLNLVENSKELEFGPTGGVKASDIKSIMAEEPHRIKDYHCGGNSEVWEHFRMLMLDGAQVPFAKCLDCSAILVHTANCGTTSLKKHYMQHTDNKYIPSKKRLRLFDDKNDNETPEWDQNCIEDIKNELQAPSQKVKDPETEHGPGVSKFAISQLIQAGSDRVNFEESTTHSAVWEKFLKIVLDSVEVPFVCCKFCRKVYTHDRTLGTSSLIRHLCAEEPDMDRVTKSGGLPRILVQELVNTQSNRVSSKPMNPKFNERLKDVTSVFVRVQVDNKETEYISCLKCKKLYLFSVTKNNVSLIKKLELHECYIKFAPSMSSCLDPQDEKDCFIIYIREPHRITLREKVKNEPNLHYFLLDGNKTDFAHCTKCMRFFAISALNFNEERIHRCHKVKTAEHNIQFKKKVPHQCDKCQAVFKSEHFLEIHMRKVHGEGSATVMCSHCAKEFPTERLAKKHEMHVHYPELSKKFACKDCDAMFHDRSKLKLHAMKHSNIKPYVCEQCGKGFNWVASFQDHMDMHSGVKKYTCEFCNRQFTKRNTLNNHRRLHTGEKPFMCPSAGCGMTFVQRTACKTHAKKRHNIEITMYTRNPEVPQTPASLAQMSLAQRMEQQQMQERIMEEPQAEVSLAPSTLAPSHIQISRAQVAQLAQGGQVVHILQGDGVTLTTGPGGQLTQIRLLDPRDGAEVLGV